jgi:acyl carrier protein
VPLCLALIFFKPLQGIKRLQPNALALFPLDETGHCIAISARMDSSKEMSPRPTELIDWLNAEGLMELDWDFPEDGDLIAAGLDSMAVMQLVVAVEDEFGVELTPDDLTRKNLATPTTLAALIARKTS